MKPEPHSHLSCLFVIGVFVTRQAMAYLPAVARRLMVWQSEAYACPWSVRLNRHHPHSPQGLMVPSLCVWGMAKHPLLA